jgi:hypothetical protein
MLKINLKQKERGVGWTGVRSVLSVHCLARLHSKKGDQLIVICKFKNHVRKKDHVLVENTVNKDLTMAFL